MRAYDFAEFVREELGGDDSSGANEQRRRSRDHLLGGLLVLVSRADPPKQYSVNTALVEVDIARGRVQVVHDLYEDRSFEMSREEFTLAVKDAIAESRDRDSGAG